MSEKDEIGLNGALRLLENDMKHYLERLGDIGKDLKEALGELRLISNRMTSQELSLNGLTSLVNDQQRAINDLQAELTQHKLEPSVDIRAFRNSAFAAIVGAVIAAVVTYLSKK